MTEQEALEAVKTAEAKVESLKAEQGALRQELAAVQQREKDILNRLSEIRRPISAYVSGQLPDAESALERAKVAYRHAHSPKIQGVPALAVFGYSHSTDKNYILLHSSGEFRIHKTSGRVIGGVGIWRDLDQAELAALDAFVASLEGK